MSPVTAYASRPNRTGARASPPRPYGVQLFFIISGFVLALPFARKQVWTGRHACIRQYFARRLTRLEQP